MSAISGARASVDGTDCKILEPSPFSKNDFLINLMDLVFDLRWPFAFPQCELSGHMGFFQVDLICMDY